MLGYVRADRNIAHPKRCIFCNSEYNVILGTIEVDGIYTTPARDLYACPNCARWVAIFKLGKVTHNLVRLGNKCWIFNRDKDISKNSIYYLSKDGTPGKFKSNEFLGIIPNELFGKLESSGVRVSRAVYEKAIKNKRKAGECKSVGCWDRYHCIWYDPKKEINGPFNIIPNDAYPGIEECPAFINKNIIEETK